MTSHRQAPGRGLGDRVRVRRPPSRRSRDAVGHRRPLHSVAVRRHAPGPLRGHGRRPRPSWPPRSTGVRRSWSTRHGAAGATARPGRPWRRPWPALLGSSPARERLATRGARGLAQLRHRFHGAPDRSACTKRSWPSDGWAVPLRRLVRQGPRSLGGAARPPPERYPPFVTGGALPRGDVPVFVFHSLEPESFERKLRHLAENGYQTLTAEEYFRLLVGAGPVPEKAVVLTFDDGAGQRLQRRRPPPAAVRYEGRRVPRLRPSRGRKSASARPGTTSQAGRAHRRRGPSPGEQARGVS